MAEGPTTARVSDCVVLAKIPDGPLSAEHFALQTEEVPEPGETVVVSAAAGSVLRAAHSSTCSAAAPSAPPSSVSATEPFCSRDGLGPSWGIGSI